DDEQQTLLKLRLQQEYRNNDVDATGQLVLSERRVAAIEKTAAYYDKLFGDAPELHASREHFAMKENPLPDAKQRALLSDFFFWTAWAAATERPDSVATYTNNWPHE